MSIAELKHAPRTSRKHEDNGRSANGDGHPETPSEDQSSQTAPAAVTRTIHREVKGYRGSLLKRITETRNEQNEVVRRRTTDYTASGEVSAIREETIERQGEETRISYTVTSAMHIENRQEGTTVWHDNGDVDESQTTHYDDVYAPNTGVLETRMRNGRLTQSSGAINGKNIREISEREIVERLKKLWLEGRREW